MTHFSPRDLSVSWQAGDDLAEDDGEGEDIRFLAVGPPIEAFGGHPVRRGHVARLQLACMSADTMRENDDCLMTADPKRKRIRLPRVK